MPTHVQGLLKIDKQVIDMKCVDAPVAPDAPEGQRDKQVNLWSGSEESDYPEGLYHVLAYRKGNSALPLAEVTINQVLLAQPKFVPTIGCKAPTEWAYHLTGFSLHLWRLN